MPHTPAKCVMSTTNMMTSLGIFFRITGWYNFKILSHQHLNVLTIKTGYGDIVFKSTVISHICKEYCPGYSEVPRAQVNKNIMKTSGPSDNLAAISVTLQNYLMASMLTFDIRKSWNNSNRQFGFKYLTQYLFFRRHSLTKFSWMKRFAFRLKYHWKLFLMV